MWLVEAEDEEEQHGVKQVAREVDGVLDVDGVRHEHRRAQEAHEEVRPEVR